LISDLHREREAAETASASQQAAAREAERAREKVTRELQSLEANRDRLIERTRREMEEELRQARLRLREALKEVERAERLTVFQRAAAIETAQSEVEAVAESAKAVEQKRRRRRRAKLPPIAPGDRVFLADIPTPGEAVSAPDAQGELDVTLGALRARINVRQIERVEKGEETGDRQPGIWAEARAVSQLPSATMPELDLRGLTVDEALLVVDQRLDEAARAGVREMRVIHGKGTGTLRRAVREMLQRHALVRAQATADPRAGGEGVTVVELVE
jgi:DNA mismatch repair protein MutS2